MNEPSEEYFKSCAAFNRKIQKEMSYGHGFPAEKTPAYWEKAVFQASQNLTIDDWFEIRDEGYWEMRDKLINQLYENTDFIYSIHLRIQLYKFIYSRIRLHLNQ